MSIPPRTDTEKSSIGGVRLLNGIAHSSGTQFVYRSYYCIHIVVANLASWERGYVNCNSTYLVKASTLSGMRLAASKSAVRSWISK